jgi:hypothetical protein
LHHTSSPWRNNLSTITAIYNKFTSY